MLREIVIMFFIANEGLSLLENCAEINGGNIPKKLKDVLLQLRGKSEDEEEEPEDSDEDTEEKDGEENVDDTEKSDGDKSDS